MGRKRIAVLMASIDREYQTDFVNAVFDQAETRGMDVCVFNCQGHMNVDVSTSDPEESAIFDLPRMRPFDGVISLRETLASEISKKKVEEALAGKPHVSIDIPGQQAVSVMFDDSIQVRELTEHMITVHGAKEIVYLSGPLNQIVAMTRLVACRETMAAHGLVLRPENIFEGEWIQSSGRKCAEELLRRGGRLPDAIMCGNDDMAFGVVEYLNEQGYSVPDHVRVTGFDALKEAVARGLTTIRRPIDQAARLAVDALAEWMETGNPSKRDILLPTLPVYGVSCGCVRDYERSAMRIRTMRSAYRRAENTLMKASMFNGSLASAATEEDAHQKINQFAEALGIREMYVCIDPSLTREIQNEKGDFAYPDHMLMLYGRRDGESLPIELFDTRSLLPGFDEEGQKQTSLVFCPLYYREQTFGYVAMEMCEATGLPLYSVLMLLTGALMSLYLQTNLRMYARKVEEMSVRDIMTGMLNRRGFVERSPGMMEQAQREGKFFVIITADMDGLKKINDQYGHLTGDAAIARMGRIVQTLEAKGMTPVHISGDEFLAYGIQETRAEADGILEAAYQAVERMNREEPWLTETSASFGLYAAVPQQGDEIDSFLTRADDAMYEEKNRKKNR